MAGQTARGRTHCDEQTDRTGTYGILDENKGISMVNPNRVYPPLPPAENIMPLMRIPEQATLCEKIGGTEYTVTAHFREDGRDLLGLLSRIFMRDTADYSFDSEGYDED